MQNLLPVQSHALWLQLAVTSIVATLCSSASAAIGEYFEQRWFVTEVIIFQRPNIQESNTLEALTETGSYVQPKELSSFLSGATPAYELNNATQNMLRTPRLNLAAPGPVPTEFILPSRSLAQAPDSGAPGLTANERANADNGSSVKAPTAAQTEAQLALEQGVRAYEQHLSQRSFHFNTDVNPRLSAEAERLQRARNYRIVWRGNWLQPVPERKAPQALLVQTGQRYDNGFFELEGSLAVTVSRYLHLHARFWFHDPKFSLIPTDAAPSDPSMIDTPQYDVGPPAHMALAASRRMRSGDLHYIDHPKFGVLVRIDPIAMPDSLTKLYKALQASQQ